MPFSPTDTGPNPFALLSLIAAPAVLTNAASVLALSTSNRFLRASERMRALSVRTEERKHSPELHALFIKQANRTERQAVLLLGGLRAAYVGIGSFASASLISILGAGLATTRWESGFHALAAVALCVGFVGAGSLVWATGKLMAATRLSMQNMTEEAALIRSREQTTSAPV
jgi:Protein of unknown function (DUF2721)